MKPGWFELHSGDRDASMETNVSEHYFPIYLLTYLLPH
jgi:hypothetical protein